MTMNNKVPARCQWEHPTDKDRGTHFEGLVSLPMKSNTGCSEEFALQTKTALWLDDMRDPSVGQWKQLIQLRAPEADNVRWVKSYDEFVRVFPEIIAETNTQLIAVFFDNDLGIGREGRHAFSWMEECVRESGLDVFGLYAQTANPAARQELMLGFGSLRRYWRR
ncbi:MAG: hypothetical protein ACI8RZ_001917 [Myxococcota bacterium]|jgi:hypothetical protein